MKPNKRQAVGPPSTEKAIKLVKECLTTAGVDPDAFDILRSPYCLISPGLISSKTDNYLPCYIAVSKSNGMAFFFPTLGPHGIYQRYKDKMVVN